MFKDKLGTKLRGWKDMREAAHHTAENWRNASHRSEWSALMKNLLVSSNMLVNV